MIWLGVRSSQINNYNVGWIPHIPVASKQPFLETQTTFILYLSIFYLADKIAFKLNYF